MEEQEKGAWTIFSLGKWDLNNWELDMHQRSGMDVLGIQGCTPPPLLVMARKRGQAGGGGEIHYQIHFSNLEKQYILSPLPQ
jgi:hypothetical protein